MLARPSPRGASCGDPATVVGDAQVHALLIDANGDLDALRLGVPDHVRYRLLADSKQGALVGLRLRHIAVEIQVQRQPAGHHDREQSSHGGRETVLLEQRAGEHVRRCGAARGVERRFAGHQLAQQSAHLLEGHLRELTHAGCAALAVERIPPPGAAQRLRHEADRGDDLRHVVVQLARQPLALLQHCEPLRLLVQPRVVDRDREVLRDDAETHAVELVERTFTLDVDYAKDLLAVEHRDRELRARTRPRLAASRSADRRSRR